MTTLKLLNSEQFEKLNNIDLSENRLRLVKSNVGYWICKHSIVDFDPKSVARALKYKYLFQDILIANNINDSHNVTLV